MALFSSVLRQLFERFAHFLLRRETPQRAQQCAAQELAVEKLPEQCEAYTVNARKHTKRRRKVPEKHPLGEREEEREVKSNKGGSHKDESEITLSLEKIKERGRVHQKKREMHSLEKLMEQGSELREAGEKKRKERKITDPTPLLVEVKPVHTTVRSFFLKPIEGELPMLPSISGHLALPAAHVKPLPPLIKPVRRQEPDPAPEDVLSLPCSPLQVDSPKLLAVPSCSDAVVSLQRSSCQMLPLAVPPRPTPAPDELFSIRRSSSQVRHPKRLPPSPTPATALQRPPSRKPFTSSPFEPPSSTPAPDEVLALRRPPSRKPLPFASSPFEPPPLLMLVDIEDEESEYVEYTGKTFRASDLLKSERPQTPEAEVKPRKMVAWMEKDSEVQEEAWASEVVEVQAFEKEEGDPSEMGDSKAIQSHDASSIDELTMKLFCVASPDETQHNLNVQTKCKRKVPLVLFTWAEEKVKKKEEKKIIKEKERREKELLLARYMNDPKLKHLWINKHNRNYSSS